MAAATGKMGSFELRVWTMPVHSTCSAPIATLLLGKRSGLGAGVALLECQGSKTCTSPSKNDIF